MLPTHFPKKKNGKSLCTACHLYARTMLIFSVLLKLTSALSEDSAINLNFSRLHSILGHVHVRF